MILVSITCSDKEEAEKIGRMLLKKRLVACVNIVDGVHSMYFWPPGKERIEEASETILLCHTLSSTYEGIEKETLAIHSYKNPTIYSVPIKEVSKRYADWLNKELRR